jgi:hypothetical protein
VLNILWLPVVVVVVERKLQLVSLVVAAVVLEDC